MNKHPTILVDVRGHLVPVDVGIASVVRWLNELPGIETTYSCQGGGEEWPYVQFRVSDADGLRQVALACRNFLWEFPADDLPFTDEDPIEIKVSTFHGELRCTIRWADTAQLARFRDFVLVPAGHAYRKLNEHCEERVDLFEAGGALLAYTPAGDFLGEWSKEKRDGELCAVD
jgi:hypothetical protein